MKKNIITTAASLATAAFLAVSASATTITPTGAPTTTVMKEGTEGKGDNPWLMVANVWDDKAMFFVSELDPGAKDIVISFDVTGCDGSYELLAGFQLNDSGDAKVAVWSKDTWLNSIGSTSGFFVDHDGSYEFIVPVNLFLEVIPSELDPDTGDEIYKDTIEDFYAVEPFFLDLPGDTTMEITVTDFWFTNTAHTLEEVASHVPGDDIDVSKEAAASDHSAVPENSESSDDPTDSEDSNTSEDSADNDNPEESTTTTTTAPTTTTTESNNSATPIIIGVVAAVIVVAIIVIVVVAAKKKK